MRPRAGDARGAAPSPSPAEAEGSAATAGEDRERPERPGTELEQLGRDQRRSALDAPVVVGRQLRRDGRCSSGTSLGPTAGAAVWWRWRLSCQARGQFVNASSPRCQVSIDASPRTIHEWPSSSTGLPPSIIIRACGTQ